MFKKLKDKIAEDLKFSPQRLTQGFNDKNQSNNSNDENFFSIAEDDAGGSTSSLGGEFTDVSLHASTPMEPRNRKLSNSSMASDISFLPRYEPSGSLYHMQSDLDASASEIEDNASTSSQLGHISKEQIYSAFQKAQMRYHKYRGRYTDLANHYKILEKENAKIRTILVDTQDKAIRRVNELKEQCTLEQKAKAHLENALRVELDEKQIKIDTLHTKIKLLQHGDRSDQLIDVSDNSRSTSNSSLSEYQELTRYLNDARGEIENLNEKLQEMKANTIIFNTKEANYKLKIHTLEKSLQERHLEVNEYSEREKENNLKLAESKMELHAEIHNKDLEIANLKKDLENFRHEVERNEKSRNNIRLENLQSQNGKLIDKIEVLNQKCSNYESELIKLEQYKIEIGNLNEIVLNLKKINEELVERKLESDVELKRGYDKSLQDINEFKIKLDVLQKENEDLKSKLMSSDHTKQEALDLLNADLQRQKVEYEETIRKIRGDAQQSLLMLETKIKEKFQAEFEEKESNIKQDFDSKLDKLLTSNESVKKIEIDLMESQDLLSKIQDENSKLKSQDDIWKSKYCELETNHLELINESNEARNDFAILEKESNNQQHTITSLEGDIQLLKDELGKVDQEILSERNKNIKLNEEIETIKKDLLNSARKVDLEDVLSEKMDEIRTMQERMEEIKKVAQEKDEELRRLRIDHEEELKVKASEYQVVRSEFSLFQEVSSKQQNDNCRLLEGKRNFEEEIAKLKEDLQMKKEEINIRNEKLEEEIADLNLRIGDYEKIKENLQEQVDELTGKCKETEIRWNKIDDDLKEKIEVIAKLNLDIEEFKKAQIEWIERNKSLEVEVEDLDKLRQQIDDKSKEVNENLEWQIEEIAKLNLEIQAYKKEEIKRKEINENLQGTIEEYEKDRVNLREINENLTKENAKLSENLQNLLKNNSNFTEEISKITEENVKLKNEIKNHLMSIKDARNEIKRQESLIKDIETKKKEIERLQDVLDRMEKENQKIKENFNEVKQKYEEVGKEKEDIFTRLMKREQENEILKEIQTKAKSELDNYKKEINQSNQTIDSLKQYEVKYQSILDENHNLKEQISKIEELRLKLHNLESIEDDFQSTTKDLENMEKQKNETLNENKKLKQEILDLKVLKEKLKGVEEENRKLIEDISHLQSRFNQKLNENQNLTGDLSKYQQLEMKFNDTNKDLNELTINCKRLSNENEELLERNQQLTSDYKQILHENEKNVSEFAEVKLKYEESQSERDQFQDTKLKLTYEIENLNRELEKTKLELSQIKSEKFSLEKLQSTTLESSETQTSTLKTKIKQLQDEKSDYESLFNEYKQMKTDINNITQLYDKSLKEKKDIEHQLGELERHYNEITHEKQLLKDEIQELKISPINLMNKSKSDNIETEKKYMNEENYLKEIEGLRDKLEQYKSIDKVNRSSIEFYEHELQKLKVKNEKLSRKLDDTLVTLPVLTSSADLGDSQAKLEYLRNVLYNYMIGRESLVLAKVIAAVCKFDKDQTDLILQKEQQRQTLVGQLFGS